MTFAKNSSHVALWQLGTTTANARKGPLWLIGIGVGVGVVAGVVALMQLRERALPEPAPEPPSLRAATNGASTRQRAD
jgi:hypothetical protein